MRIKKVSQTTPTQAQVVDGYSTSTTDSYSANYVNGKINDINDDITDINNLINVFNSMIVKTYNAWISNSVYTIDTDISVNASSGGRALLVLASGHMGAGDATFASIWLIRCGYNGDNVSSTKVSTLAGGDVSSDTLSFSANSSGNLKMSTTWRSGRIKLAIIGNA